MNRLEKIGAIVITIDPRFVRRIQKEIKESDLTSLEKSILIKKLFSDMSIKEVGEKYNLTRKQVRQIHIKGVIKIRNQIMNKKLQDILNPTNDLRKSYSEEMEKTDLKVLRLPAYIEHKLEKAGITNLKAIIEADKEEILKIKGIGSKRYQLIESAVDDIILQEFLK